MRTLPDTPCPITLPCDLFAGCAPQLRSVRLATVTLPDDPVAAFRSVIRAIVTYKTAFPRITFARQFPSLRDLEVDYSDDQIEPSSFNLSGVTLGLLAIGDSSTNGLLDSVARSVDLSSIPLVLVICDNIEWNEPLWANDRSPISVRLSFATNTRHALSVFIVPAHRRWRRLFRVRTLIEDEPLHIGTVPNLGTRMTYLRIDAPFLRDFLELELALPALLTLHIDVETHEKDELAPPGYEAHQDVRSFSPEPAGSRVWMPSAALENITLFALDAPVRDVDSRRVAFLAHALGAKADKAVLELIGVTFAEPVARALINETVSEIRNGEFAGYDWRKDLDDGLWEQDF
ncbi:hypothetical protein AURDEDRAFT_124342 [Auricularia subglabra TFB-10046 SS5]|nr:hypothetical protein AURDEDRAFT_124342 [Auricularia subglabra TFB-10046 SS5]